LAYISGSVASDQGGGTDDPSTIKVRKDSSSPAHLLARTNEAGLSGVYSLSAGMVELTSSQTFQAEVIRKWGSGSPPDAKIYLYGYLIG
jgi:hypothetical protein